jgi:hypothetical protein
MGKRKRKREGKTKRNREGEEERVTNKMFQNEERGGGERKEERERSKEWKWFCLKQVWVWHSNLSSQRKAGILLNLL